MNIIEDLYDKNLLDASFPDISSWMAWEDYLRALFGLWIKGEASLKLIRECTGLEAPPSVPAHESDVIAGRRSGKSTMAAAVAVYLATSRDWAKLLGRGEKGWIFILSVDELQSRVIKGYVIGMLNGSKIFRSMIVKETSEEVWLRARPGALRIPHISAPSAFRHDPGRISEPRKKPKLL